MAKTKISEFSTTAGNNTDINSINIAEGCAPSGINDAIRELMRQLKEFQTGGAGDSVNSGGDFSVATNKFTVASATGNTAVAGTLGSTGNFAINTDKFTVTASSGNTAVAGTLASTGNFAVNTDKFTVAASSGNTAVAGTFAVTGATTLTGALVANGNSTLGDADTDTVTLNASFVNGTTLKTAKSDTNTLALAAYDVDGTAYTNLVTLTAGNTPSLALTSTAVGTINNMSIGATTASTGAFTTLSASGNVTLSGGTANGVLYLNGSKVATSGSALTFDGTNLGIGTSSPAVKLQVYNNINGTPFAWGNATRTGYLYQDQNGVGITNASGTSFDEGVYLDTANSKVILYTNSTDRVTLDSSGNLGLGVTPSTWSAGYSAIQIGASSSAYAMNSGNDFHLGLGATYNAGWKYTVSSVAVSDYFQTSGQHIWRYAASGTSGNALTWSEGMRLNASGNLGIGTTSPISKLDLNGGTGDTSATDAVLSLTRTSSTGNVEAIKLVNTAKNTNYGNFVVRIKTTPSSGESAGYYTDALTIDGQNGNVGIGTTSPNTRLTIGGYSSSNQTPDIQITRSSSGTAIQTGPNITFGDGTTNNATTLQVTQGRFGVWNYGGGVWAERMSIDASGNLGLGVTPSAWASGNKFMDVNSSASFGAFGSTDTMMLANAYWNGSNWIRKNAQNAFRFVMESINTTPTMNWQVAANGAAGSTISFTQAMTLDASGRLGVGTTSLFGKFNVGDGSNGRFELSSIASGITAEALNSARTNAADLNLYGKVFTFNNKDGGSYVESARIDSSGNLLMGKASLTDTGAGFAFGGGSNAGLSYFARSSGIVMSLHRYTTTGDIVRFVYDGTPVGTISVTGSATAYNTSSDYRLKNIDGPLTGSGAFIDALKPKVGTWKADGSKFVGFIAHEVQEVSPGSVTGEKDGEEMQAMEYGSAEFIANIIAELQSLRKRLADAGIA